MSRTSRFHRTPQGHPRSVAGVQGAGSGNRIVSPMEFFATESGFENGMGGASNAAGTADYHYVLFGRQIDQQHPECSGVYFEFDDQIHGAVDGVAAIAVTNDRASFELRDGQRIVVERGMAESQWSGFLRGIHDAFGDEIVHKG